MDVNASWDLVSDIRQMFAYTFMVHAFQAGTLVAIGAGLLGWFMVLRRQTFAGHTLSVVAFPGASAASLAGVALSWGYFGACVLAAGAIALAGGVGRRFSQESAIIAIVQSFALACGFLFVALSHSFLGGANALLFGSFLGITDGQVVILLVTTVVAVVVLAVIGRPLFFASVDPAVARAAGIPVRAMNAGFLLLLGLVAAEVSQITGALLVFALLVMPAATAQRITARPVFGLVLTTLIGLLVTWVGLTLAFFTDEPVGFTITSVAFGLYVLAIVISTVASSVVSRNVPAGSARLRAELG